MSNHDDTQPRAAAYMPGERVRVKFSATLEQPTRDGQLVARIDGADHGFILPAEANIERERPADGEPRPGELWRDRADRIWFVRDGGRMVSETGSDLPWTLANRGHGPMVCIFRPSPSVDYIPAAEAVTPS